MADSNNQDWAPRPMTISIVDHGQTIEVTNVDRWVTERKGLLRDGRDIVRGYDGNPPSLYPKYGVLVRIARRLSEIKAIFETYNRERNRHADASIIALVAYFNDPETMEGVDD